jgi:hypothetical protein
VNGARRPGPIAGLAAGAALGAALFGVAVLLLGRPGRGRVPDPPPGFSRGEADPRAPTRVLAGVAADGTAALLLPLREDGGDTGAEEALLDRDLFPEGPRHRWARLVVSCPPGAKPARVALGPGAIVLEGPAGPRGNEDLAAAVAARLPALPAHRALDLGVHRAAEREVEVAPGAFVRILVAFPLDADLRAASAASLGGALRLLPRESPVDRLRTALLDGDIASLPDADRAEARPDRPAGPPGAR